MWAEKEMRNLKRLVAAGIPSPAPVLIKNNVLVMDFLGRGGWPAPRLRDVQLGPKKMKVWPIKKMGFCGSVVLMGQ